MSFIPPENFLHGYKGSTPTSFVQFVADEFQQVVPPKRNVSIRETSCIERKSMNAVIDSVTLTNADL
jgi:hypothetical protein